MHKCMGGEGFVLKRYLLLSGFLQTTRQSACTCAYMCVLNKEGKKQHKMHA